MSQSGLPVTALGKPSEEVVPEAVGEDDVHHVQKRSLNDIIID